MLPLVLTIFLSIIFTKIILTKIDLAVYYFVPYNYLFDLIFSSAETSTAIISTVIRVIVVGVFFFNANKKKFFSLKKPAFNVFMLLIVILLFSSFFISSNVKSFLETVKFFLILFSFFTFYVYFVNHALNAILFRKMVFNLLWITIVNIVISNIFSLGWAGYGENVGFYTGGISSNMWYVPAFALVSVIAIFFMNEVRVNYWLSFSAIVVFIILIVALRRSAYIVLIIAALNALFFLRIKTNVIKLIFGVLLAIASLLPFFYPFLEKQIDARTKTFDKTVDEESRFKETEELWNERFETSPTSVFLFGEKPFNSVGNYGNGSFGDRPLHVDMNIVFYSAGLIGLLLYVLFYLIIFNQFVKITSRLKSMGDKTRIFKYLFVSTFLSLIALSFSGGLNALTYRMFAFMILGLSLGQIRFFSLTFKRHETKEYLVKLG